MAPDKQTTLPPDDISRQSDDDLWDTEKARKYLGISMRTMRRWIASGSLPFVRVGRQIRFRPDSMREWVSKRETGDAA